MKSIKYLLAILIVTAVFSCNKKLDVLPQNNVTEIKTGDDVTALLFGGYSLMQNSSGFGEQYIFVSDLLADNNQLNFVGSFTDYSDLTDKVQISTNALATTIWENSYLIIQNMNLVLDNIGLIDEDQQKEITAEAKFMRGVAYFELVNYFAQPYSAGNVSSNPGVPIVLTPTYNYDSATQKPTRSSVEDVYKQVIKDFTESAADLPETGENARVTKYSADAFLARVYLNMNDYTNAATFADKVIESGNYSLTSTFNQAFNNPSNSTEDIFGIQNTPQSNAGTTNNGLVTFYRYAYDADGNNKGGRGDAQVNDNYLTIFDDPNDFRSTFFTEGYSTAGTYGTYTLKWLTFYRVIPVVRLAEMYLTRGEANLRKGGAPIGGVSPEDDINIVRERAGAEDLSGVTGNDFVKERFRELGFEGDRLWTLKRLKFDVDDLPFDAPELVLPIPQREIDVNGNLNQNEGY